MPTLLVIDDEPSILYAFRQLFREPKVTLLTAATGGEGLEQIRTSPPDVVILDINLPDISGLELYRRIRQINAKIPTIFITAHGTTDTAIEAMQLGALEYLLKPLHVDELGNLVERAFSISRLMRVPAVVADEVASPDDSADAIVGRSPAMQKVYKAIGRVAAQDVTVLVLGETGTGKELVARAIYHHSHRKNGPFLAINCAAIPETLLESELFGHERGAFTGAERKRIGKFEQCCGGTIFLDEIGDMTPQTQAKVLRVLQDQRFERVGGSETITANVRVIAATNRNLEQMVCDGQFRADLFYRLRVYAIELPPLRARADDVPLLAEYLVRRFRRELGKDVSSISPEAVDLLRGYTWPGNVRELQSVLKRAILESSGPVLLPDFLPAQIRSPSDTESLVTAAAETSSTEYESKELDSFIAIGVRDGSESLHSEWMSRMERLLILRVLRHTAGNQTQAAKLLGIDRATLRSKIRSYDIAIDRTVS